jgi:hypothetical protein
MGVMGLRILTIVVCYFIGHFAQLPRCSVGEFAVPPKKENSLWGPQSRSITSYSRDSYDR